MKSILRLLRFKLVKRKRKISRESMLWSTLMSNERKIREQIEQMVLRNKYVSAKSRYKITLSKPRQIVYLYKQNEVIRDELRKLRKNYSPE
tara:strand:+ start:603 stop:875 length:273 start_codon:yes stop_codon:yes gene_type:complete